MTNYNNNFVNCTNVSLYRTNRHKDVESGTFKKMEGRLH